jgi:dienelactone hydrolase
VARPRPDGPDARSGRPVARSIPAVKRLVVGVLVTSLLVACSTDDDGGGGSAVTSPDTTADDSTTPTPLEVSTRTWDDGTITLSDGAPTQDWGVVAAPTSGGPHPVAVVLHGNHPTCPTDIGGGTWPCPPGTEAPNHEGLTYLAEALAARGFVAVAPGINVQYTLGAGEPAAATRTAEIVERALTALDEGRLGVDPGSIDSSKLVLIGHSVGGQDASIIANQLVPITRPVSGVVMLQPALNDAAALPLVDVPAVVLLAECDGDVGLRPGDYVATAMLEPRAAPSAVVVLERANHNFTNSNLAPDAFPVESPACDDGRRLTAQEQRAAHAAFVPELAHAVLGDGTGTGWAGSVFDEPATPDGVLLGVVPAGEPAAPVPGPGPRPPGDLRADGMTLTFCPECYSTPFVAPGSEPCHRPELPMMVGYPRTIAASWDAVGATIAVPVSAGPGDVARLRVVPDIADERLDAPLRLRLSAPDGPSTEVDVALAEVRRELIDPFFLTFGLAMWSTVTLPLPDGARELVVEVLDPPAGSMQVVSLGTHGPP